MAINPYDPYAQEILGLEQQKATAQKLREQAMTPAQGQMVSGWYVAPNITQHLAKALQGYTGMVGEEKAQQGIKDIIGKAQKEQKDWLQSMPTFRTETSMSPYMAETAAGGRDYADITSPQAYQQKTIQPSSEGFLSWSMTAPGMAPSERATMAMSAANLRENRAQRIQELEARLAEGRLSRQEKADTEIKLEKIRQEGRADQARLIAELRGNKGADWKYDAGSDTWVKPPSAEFPQGQVTVNPGKAGAAKNLDYLANQFTGSANQPGLIDKATTGGWMGVSGLVGRATNSQAAREFENKAEQMSTELRKIFRIPGEGALSDKEQAQYGIQLPKLGNDPAVNRRIIDDLRIRTQNAVFPQGSNQLAPSPTLPSNAPPPGAVRRIQ